MNATLIRDQPNRTTLVPGPRVRRQDSRLRKPSVHSIRDAVKHVRLSCEVLGDQFEPMLEAWFRFLGSHPLVLYYFTQKSYDRPDAPAVRKAFAQWIADTGMVDTENKGQEKVLEPRREHCSPATNRKENADALQSVILRYVLALLYPVTAKQKQHQAWVKSVLQETFVLAASTARDDRRTPTVQSALVT